MAGSGRKRAAAEDATTEKRETRSSKAPKTAGSKSAAKAPKGTARLKARLIISDKSTIIDCGTQQTSMAKSTFKSRAVPLYVNITTTAPAPEDQEPAPTDPGFLASTTLVPSTFATGSFGWKGHKRMVVELPEVEGGEEGRKVHVTLTINATVIGSKDVKEGEEHEGEHEGPEEYEEASGEAAEPKHEGEVKESGDNPTTGEEQAVESAS